MRTLILIVLLYFLVRLGHAQYDVHLYSFDIYDGTSKGDKQIVQKMAATQTAETKMKAKRALFIAINRVGDDDLHYGIILAQMREFYKSMLEIYKGALRNLIGSDVSLDKLVMPPIYGTLRPIHYVMYMNKIRDYENKITAALEAIRHQPRDAVALDPARFDKVKKTRKDAKEALRMKEARLKSLVRQQHLMKKLGLPENTSTSSKRFIGKWPVPETWDLERTY